MRISATAVSALAALAVTGGAWFFLAPPQLGGRTSYAVVDGSSMEPRLHRGDLVLLRHRADYHAGEVVAYRSRTLQRTVLHRVVAIRGGRFIFKGDNNSFVDPERPLQSQLLGREWLVLPSVGAVVETLRSPRNVAVLAGAAVLLLGLGGGASRRRRRRSQVMEAATSGPGETEAAAPEPATRGPDGRRMGQAAIGLVIVGATILGVGALLGIVADTRPTHRTVIEPNLYVQRGQFSYSAIAPVGPVYQTRALGPSDPIFLRMVHRLGIRFTYRIHSQHPSAFAGSARLDAVLEDGRGWRRRFPIAKEQRLSGGRVSVGGRLDLERLSEEVRQFEELTGEHNPDYRVTLAANVRLNGTIAGRAIHTTFAPVLALDLDETRLQLEQPADGGPPNALVRAQAAPATRTEPLTFHTLGVGISVGRTRLLALAIVGSGLAFGLVGVLVLLLEGRGDELRAIERRYRGLIVPVAAAARPTGVERRVATMDALAQLAESYERPILHEQVDGRHSFLVEEGGFVYCYDLGSVSSSAIDASLDERHGWRRLGSPPADVSYGWPLSPVEHGEG